MNTLTRTQRNYTDEQLETLETLVKSHNEEVGFSFDRYLIVDLTGNKKVFFTLYRYSKPVSAYVNPYNYVKNLSIDIEKAVADVIKRAKSISIGIIVCSDNNNNPLLTNFHKRTKEGIPNLPFGKYRGMSIAEVWDIDQKYIFWFLKEYKTKAYNGRFPDLTLEDSIMKQNAKDLISIFFDEKAEENRATSTSEHIGTLKERFERYYTINKIKRCDGGEYGDDYTLNYAKDDKGNCVSFYGNFPIEEGKRYLIKGTAVDHKEVVGVKTTRLNRVAIIN
jgi:uncharacterized protein (DUF3820 family)